MGVEKGKTFTLGPPHPSFAAQMPPSPQGEGLVNLCVSLGRAMHAQTIQILSRAAVLEVTHRTACAAALKNGSTRDG